MKVTMVIPSYWARESGVGWKEGDAIYDHPSPLDSEGTLLRANLFIYDEYTTKSEQHKYWYTFRRIQSTS